MTKRFLVVDGQHLNLDRCGGAGRYGSQLHQRLLSPGELPQLANCELFLANFQEVDSLTAPAAASGARLPLDTLKHMVARSCPPFLFDRLQRFYDHREEAGPPLAPPPSAWNQLHSPTVVHELTNYFMMEEIGRLSLSPQLRLAVTFLDIQDFYYPEYFPDKTLLERRLAYSFYKDRADIFFAISEFTRQTMIERLGIPPHKIRVTHLAADDLLVLQPSRAVRDWVQALGRFWLYPAKAWKHKNHAFLLRTMGLRRQELTRAGYRLMLTGGFSEADRSYLEKLIREHGLEDIVEILGFVSDEQLQALLVGAEYLVFPSLFEGFGMPVLEAMTLGCPVISSNAGSLPEVCGDAALLFDPKDQDELLALIDGVLSETATDRSALIERGFQNCKRFSWDKTYRETVAGYEDIL